MKKELSKWDGKAPSLHSFKIEPEAALYPYFRSDAGIDIPAVPAHSRPSLILRDLENVIHMDKPVYKYIDSSQKKGPIGLYGTSGAGKTRTVFEYLSHNFGFYFVVETENNPGSEDVTLLLQKCEDKLSKIDLPAAVGKGETEENEKKSADAENATHLNIVHAYLKTLVGARHAVFAHINASLLASRGKCLTCHEWLLLQLYPIAFLGSDVFRDLFRSLCAAGVIPIDAREQQMSCFVDEAQVLLGKLDGYFLSADLKIGRSAYSAFAKGLRKLAISGTVHHPCFSGTGMSIEQIKTETKSLMVKPDAHNYFCTGLQSMSADDVKQYMKRFLDLCSVGEDLVNHVANWLRGRPRWTATFLETFFVTKIKLGQERPLGKFKECELPLARALNRYIKALTQPEIIANRRQSLIFGRSAAYTAIKTLYSKPDSFKVIDAMRTAIFKFALSGNKATLSCHAAELIEYGVASVDSDSDSQSSTYIIAKIDEPLIVQAGINFFDLRATVTDNFVKSSDSSNAGNLFERFILPGIQDNFTEMVGSRVSENLLRGLEATDRKEQLATMKQVAVPKWSSYGVLAVDTADVPGTLKWILDSLDARFEGQVAPFCYPDTLMGPDVLFFMRTPKYEDFLFVASQAKCKNVAVQMEALRTVKPSLFYHENRTSGGKLNKNLTEQQKSEWAKVQEKLFGMVAVEDSAEALSKRRATSSSSQEPATKRTRVMVRLLVQYAPLTRNGASGPVAFASASASAECVSTCTCEKHDLLVTIDASTADELLGANGQMILNLVKTEL